MIIDQIDWDTWRNNPVTQQIKKELKEWLDDYKGRLSNGDYLFATYPDDNQFAIKNIAMATGIVSILEKVLNIKYKDNRIEIEEIR